MDESVAPYPADEGAEYSVWEQVQGWMWDDERIVRTMMAVTSDQSAVQDTAEKGHDHD